MLQSETIAALREGAVSHRQVNIMMMIVITDNNDDNDDGGDLSPLVLINPYFAPNLPCLGQCML